MKVAARVIGAGHLRWFGLNWFLRRFDGACGGGGHIVG
jgi:hypothetical protein